MLIRGAEVAGQLRDVRCENGRIEALAAKLPPRPREAIVEARGGALLPGLHDHHLHLFALAAALESVVCGPPQITSADALSRVLHAAPVRAGWIRGTGYFESVARDKGILLSVTREGDGPDWLSFDRVRVHQCVTNLISNADKYSPPGSDIGIHLDSADGLLHCTVLNSGAEIPEQDLARLFERFFRGSHAERSSSGGIGLGLAIARTLAQWHQGSLNASRREGGGAAFTLQLPLRWSTAAAELV